MQFGTFRFCFMGGFQRRATALLGRKNPKKPAVSWQGIQRGQRPLGTRLCLQSLVCYTFAKELAADGLFCPKGLGKRRRARLELRGDYSGKRQPGPAPSKGILSRCASLPQIIRETCTASERGITLILNVGIIVIPPCDNVAASLHGIVCQHLLFCQIGGFCEERNQIGSQSSQLIVRHLCLL